MVNKTGAMLEVVCVFVPNTEAIGCEVAVTRLSNEDIFGRVRANRTGNSAIMTFLKVLADEYRLDVFEVESNGSLTQAITELVQLSAQPFTSENSVLFLSLAVLPITTISDFKSECNHIYIIFIYNI